MISFDLGPDRASGQPPGSTPPSRPHRGLKRASQCGCGVPRPILDSPGGFRFSLRLVRFGMAVALGLT